MPVMTFKYPKARKPHVCQVCGCSIPKGTVHHYQTGVYDGSYQSWRAHSDCAEMHWHHNKDRAEDDQADDYLRNGYRGRWPHAICRIELRVELGRIAWRKRRDAEHTAMVNACGDAIGGFEKCA